MAGPQLRLPAFPGDLGQVCRRIQAWADQFQRQYDTDLAKILASEYAHIGEFHFSTAAATSLAGANQWTRAAGTTQLDSAGEFAMPRNNCLQHTGLSTNWFLVIGTFSLSCASANQDVDIGISKNGETPDVNTQRQRRIGTAGDTGMGATHGLFRLGGDDFVEYQVQNETSTGAITIDYGALTAVRIV